MQRTVSLDLLVSVSESGFSLDELVVVLKKVADEKGLAGIASMILRLVDQMLQQRNLHDGSLPGEPCCERPAYEALQLQDRRVRSSIGKIEFRWRRYVCKQCGKTRVPLRDFLGLEQHQSKTNELEQVVVEVITDQSYRRSSRHLKNIGGIPVPRTTAHRWVTETESDQVETPEEKLSSLLVDGTGYKRRPDPEAGLDNKGGLRMALGITNAGRVKVLGTWSGLSWEQIARQLAQGGSEGDKKLAGLLVTDGEPGLGEALGELTEDHQRCLWHMTHDLDDPMWRDGASKAERRATQKNLAGLLRIELPPEDGEPVASEDYQEIRRKVRQAEEEIDRLVEGLTDRGYRRAAKYVGQARDRLFSYIRFWLRYGVVNPKVTSFIERLMREVGRRLKRIAFGWRPENAAKMARLILKRITNAAEWEEYWRKRLRLEGNVIIAYLGVRSSPQESGR